MTRWFAKDGGLMDDDDVADLMARGDSQDYADGAALRRLREALPDMWEVHIEGTEDGRYMVSAGVPRGQWQSHPGATVAEAADRCREALSRPADDSQNESRDP